MTKGIVKDWLFVMFKFLRKNRTRYIVGHIVFAVFLFVIVTTVLVIVGNTLYIQRAYLRADIEYQELREQRAPIIIGNRNAEDGDSDQLAFYDSDGEDNFPYDMTYYCKLFYHRH